MNKSMIVKFSFQYQKKIWNQQDLRLYVAKKNQIFEVPFGTCLIFENVFQL